MFREEIGALFQQYMMSNSEDFLAGHCTTVHGCIMVNLHQKSYTMVQKAKVTKVPYECIYYIYMRVISSAINLFYSQRRILIYKCIFVMYTQKSNRKPFPYIIMSTWPVQTDTLQHTLSSNITSLQFLLAIHSNKDD